MNFNKCAGGNAPVNNEDPRFLIVCDLEGALIGRSLPQRDTGEDIITESCTLLRDSALELKYNFSLLESLSRMAERGDRVIIAADTNSNEFLEFCKESLSSMEGLGKKRGFKIDVSSFDVMRVSDVLELKDIYLAFVEAGNLAYSAYNAAIRVLISQDKDGVFSAQPSFQRIHIISGIQGINDLSSTLTAAPSTP